MKIRSFSRIHRHFNFTAAKCHALSGTAILGILGIVQPLHIGFRFKQIAIGEDLYPAVAFHHHAAGIEQALALTDGIFFGSKLKVRPQHQSTGLIVVIFNAVDQGSGILTMLHTQMPLYLNAIHLIIPNRGIVNGKFSLPAVSVFIGSGVRKSLRGEKIHAISCVQLLADAVHQVDTHIGCFFCCHQNTLIAAGDRINAGDGSITSPAVR